MKHEIRVGIDKFLDRLLMQTGEQNEKTLRELFAMAQTAGVAVILDLAKTLLDFIIAHGDIYGHGQQYSSLSLYEKLEYWVVDSRSSGIEEIALQMAHLPQAARVFRDWRGHCRQFASLLASKQDPPRLIHLVENNLKNPVFREFVCLLIQELVIRGVDWQTSSPVTNFWGGLTPEQHPLAELSLRRGDFETQLSTPQYSECCKAFNLPFSDVPREGPSVSLDNGASGNFQITPMSPEMLEGCDAAFSGWLDESNGTTEVSGCEFHGKMPFSTDQLPELMFNLDLACLGKGSPHTLFLKSITPEEVFQALFVAAANGGAYDGGQQGGYGRLLAYHSFISLAGGGNIQDPDSVSRWTDSCLFFQFDTRSSSWFQHVAWDIGIICIRPDRKSLVILAATDTD